VRAFLLGGGEERARDAVYAARASGSTAMRWRLSAAELLSSCYQLYDQSWREAATPTPKSPATSSPGSRVSARSQPRSRIVPSRVLEL
jgi:hypothetical protein